jgi:hypothetical protein
MAVKNNPFLEALEAKLEAKYQAKKDRHLEFDRIAFMKTVNEELGVGPGRAYRVFNAFQANRVEIAEKITEDYGKDKHTGDKQILHTKATYANFLKRVFGPEAWEKVKIWFPLLKEYWEG